MKYVLRSTESKVTGLFFLLLAVFPAAGTAQTRNPLPVPDVPGFRTLKGDFHLHTVMSDGDVWPTARMVEAWRDGLDVISITDHSAYGPHKDDLKIDLNRSYQLVRPMGEKLGIIVIPGVEVAQGDIHCNALFVKDPEALKSPKLIENLQRAREQNAFVFWNHPGWKQPAEWFPLIAEAYDQKLIQGMELVNGESFYPEAYPWIASKQLAILADSDAHAPVAPAVAGDGRPITLLFVRSADEVGVREALFERRSAAWMGGEVWGPEEFLAGLWKSAAKVENPGVAVNVSGERFAVRLRNDSALNFNLRVLSAPAWVRGLRSSTQLRGQSILAVPFSAAKDAPLGKQAAEILFEVTNFHVGPGKNLSVTLPLDVTVSQ